MAGIGIQIIINEIRRALLDAPLATGRIVAVVQPDRIGQRIIALGADCGRRIKVAGQDRCRAKIQGRGADVATADDGGGRRSLNTAEAALLDSEIRKLRTRRVNVPTNNSDVMWDSADFPKGSPVGCCFFQEPLWKLSHVPWAAILRTLQPEQCGATYIVLNGYRDIEVAAGRVSS